MVDILLILTSFLIITSIGLAIAIFKDEKPQ